MSQGPGGPGFVPSAHVRLAFPTQQGLRFSNPRIPDHQLLEKMTAMENRALMWQAWIALIPCPHPSS